MFMVRRLETYFQGGGVLGLFAKLKAWTPEQLEYGPMLDGTPQKCGPLQLTSQAQERPANEPIDKKDPGSWKWE